jgi:hypothetical protein
MVHVPIARIVIVVPLTLQTAVVADVNETVNPDVAVATALTGDTPKV